MIALVATLISGSSSWAADDPPDSAPNPPTAKTDPQPSGHVENQPAAPASALKMNLENRGIKDNAPIPNWVRDDPPDEAKAYCDVLLKAHDTSQEEFAANVQRDVTYAHIFKEPAKYRGVVVHIEGQLVRLRRFDAPQFIWEQGVREVYEGWIYDLGSYGPYPVCVVFTDLPPGLEVAEKIDRRDVSFDGFFFKRYRYQAGDGLREAPLVIGHTLVLQDAAAVAPAGAPLRTQYIWAATGLVAFLILGGILMTVWYRRGDRKVRARLATTRLDGLAESPFDETQIGEGESPTPPPNSGSRDPSGNNGTDEFDR